MQASEFLVPPGTAVDLDHFPTNAKDPEGKDDAVAELAELITELQDLQEMLWAQHEHRVLVILQARDAGGKDGTIRKVFSELNPQSVKVTSFKQPTEPELDHDYLWRVHTHVPGNGELMVFNRSHYEDVLVVRVRDLVPKARWKKRYRQIREFERMLVEEGTTIVKFHLHISKDEQRARLQARVDDPKKHWKFAPADVAEREHWDSYRTAYEEMLEKTSTDVAPWYVIPSDHKWFRSLEVARIMVHTLRGLGLEYPPADPDLAGVVVT